MNTVPGTNIPESATAAPITKSSARLDDEKFTKDAALRGMIEVELGKLAVEKASRDDVKKFARKMIDDYTNANGVLMQVARKADIQIPGALDAKHQSRFDKLSALSGEAFEKAYIHDEVKHCQSEVTGFRAEAQTGGDPVVKAFAAYRLPSLQEDLKMVKNLGKEH